MENQDTSCFLCVSSCLYELMNEVLYVREDGKQEIVCFQDQNFESFVSYLTAVGWFLDSSDSLS